MKQLLDEPCLRLDRWAGYLCAESWVRRDIEGVNEVGRHVVLRQRREQDAQEAEQGVLKIEGYLERQLKNYVFILPSFKDWLD